MLTKVINLLDNTPNQSSKCKQKNWVEINNESWVTYDANNDIKFKTSMMRLNVGDYSDAHAHVKENITFPIM